MPAPFTVIGIARSRSDNIVPLHRGGVRPISPDHLERIFRERMVEEPSAPEAIYGIGDALADFISDPRFLAGTFAGAMFTACAAFVIAFA
jgi:hypothetical protein